MYYTINVYNTTTFPVTVWLGRNYTSSGFPVPTTSIFHTNHNINFSYFRLHLSMHQQQVKKLHQLIMEAVQGRSILDITRGFELQP